MPAWTESVRTLRRRVGFAGFEPPRWSYPVGWVALAAVGISLPYLTNSYWLSVATTMLTFALLGIGLNIVVGYAGLLDLGYSAFFAIGAYTSALLEAHTGLGFWRTLPLSVLAAAAAGVIIGYPTLRLRSDYLAIVTLGFGEIVRIIATNLDVTGGPNGLYGVDVPKIGGRELIGDRPFYLLGLVLVALAIVYTSLLSRSRLGRAWRSLREDETAAEAVGVPTVRVKLLAYVMGAMVGGIAGPYFAARFGAVDPTSFTYQTSVQILIVVVLGGMGSVPGVLLGAAVVVGLPEALRSVADYRLLLFAIALIVLMLVRPEGLWPVSARARRGQKPIEVGRPPPAAAVARLEVDDRAPLITVRELRRSFGGVTAVDDVSFTVHAGEILSIIGPNGAGKTTVFNCITGVTPPDSGSVELVGVGRLGRLAPHRVVKAGLARTFQGIRLFNGLTVLDNVLVGMYAHRTSWIAALARRGGRGARGAREEQGEALRWLEFVDLGRVAGRRASELSYGDRRRLEIARALASNPRGLLLDEPAAGTNPTEKQELVGLIRRIRDTGIAILLIEHDMALVMGLSDRVVVMDHGRVIADGPPERVQADPQVIEAYLGTDEDLFTLETEEVR